MSGAESAALLGALVLGNERSLGGPLEVGSMCSELRDVSGEV